jgi:hypothetical protein
VLKKQKRISVLVETKVGEAPVYYSKVDLEVTRNKTAMGLFQQLQAPPVQRV